MRTIIIIIVSPTTFVRLERDPIKLSPWRATPEKARPLITLEMNESGAVPRRQFGNNGVLPTHLALRFGDFWQYTAEGFDDFQEFD